MGLFFYVLRIWAQQRVCYVFRHRFVSLIFPYTIRCLHASMQNLFFLHGFLDFKTSFSLLICTNPSIHCPLFACKHAEFIFLPCKFQCGSAGSFFFSFILIFFLCCPSLFSFFLFLVFSWIIFLACILSLFFSPLLFYFCFFFSNIFILYLSFSFIIFYFYFLKDR